MFVADIRCALVHILSRYLETFLMTTRMAV